jgi:nitrite reductase/ring-hydroxylating ferredoxin subunit
MSTDPDQSDWTRVMPLADLPEGKPAHASVGSLDVFLYRTGDRIFAMANRCSHQGGPLNRGVVRAGPQPSVTCPVHGSIFWMTDGRVVRGPATAPQAVYDTRVNGEMLEIKAR